MIDLIVPLDKSNPFTEEHLKLHVEHFQKTRYPILSKEFDSIELSGNSPRILSRSIVNNQLGEDTFGQESRAGGAHTKQEENDLFSSFDDGFDLLEPLPCVFQPDPNVEYYEYITGHGRDRVFDKKFIDDIMAYVFVPKTGASDSKIKDNLSVAGQLSQDKKRTYTPIKTQDIKTECLRAVKNGWISFKGKNEREAFDTVMGRIDEMCERRPFSNRDATLVALSVMMQSESYEGLRTIPFDNSQARKWCKENNYGPVYEKGMDITDDTKIIYFPTSYDLAHKHLLASCKIAVDNDVEVRMVFHAGVLTSDPEEQYNKRTLKCHIDVKESIENVRACFNEGGKLKRGKVKMYGMIPAIEKLHNLDKLNIFDRTANDGSFKVFN